MASSYDKDFPPLESSSNQEWNLFSRLFIQSTEVLPDGSLKQPSQVEQVLNWHTRNATIHNRSSPPPSRPPDHSQFFKSTKDLFRKYPSLSTPPEQPSLSRMKRPSPRKKKTPGTDKHSPPDHRKHAFYATSHQLSSSGTSDDHTNPQNPLMTPPLRGKLIPQIPLTLRIL
ncbi:hypothetical protein Ddye_001747 [Dipteronia dyeriana]|uniref:Uncharacterized protein n=1 Tax=Dipteronia dyeriana TaxID=168575 RepID=A0AAD9XQF9_9ROSI|nr:hypothetical protein Ddye_001747 [Dipteronia dyeriana]